MKLFRGMKARSIGPAGMSGRVTAIDVVLSNPDVIYIGTASGGVWRSRSGGVHWQPIFDDQPVASIGAVAVDQRIPDVIWVGTGEGNPRNSQSSGNGIYKSIDGGKTWQHLGLEKTRNIHRILIDPYNSDIVYAAAQGSAWGEGEERGLYKTTDGGRTWKKILYINKKTGAADLVMDPGNPNKLVAAMWEYRRWPWFFKSGGPGSGLYVTYDRGKTWKKRTEKDGLPRGELGRIGLAISRSMPNIIYALIEAKKTALYRSDDGGFHWKKMSDSNIGSRPFYYADLFVDPRNENRLYNLHSIVTVSEDGGKTFHTLIPWQDIHPDHHAWWIHPDDPHFIIDGNDGGLAISRDRGKTWRFIHTLPLAQFYHINYDFDKPYNIYGGMQDNGSWRGPSRIFQRGGIRNSHWQELSFGDGFDVVPDSSNPRYGYSMSQGGWVNRYDILTGYLKTIRPYHPEGKELRFNWNAAIAHDPFDSTTIYYGSQYVHKSSDRGDTWEIISPDLTTNNPQKQKQLESGGLTYDVTNAENYTTIISIAPSPIKKGVIWVGTDDGNVQLTRDGGKNWTNLSPRISGMPEGGWVAQIISSSFNDAEAFVVVNNYRQDDWMPYVFHTTNYGKSWKRIVGSRQVYGHTLSFVQDMVESRLYFLGTESGLYVSIDAGKSWTKWTQGYPTVSTMDLKIHPREHDLIVGTFGRAAYIIDNIEPLRALAREGKQLLQKPIHLFPVPEATMMVFKSVNGARFPGAEEFKGENRPYGAMFTYILTPDNSKKTGRKGNDKDQPKEENGKKKPTNSLQDSVKIEIIDASGKVIRTIRKKPVPGVNRYYWNFRQKGVRFPGQPKPKKEDAPEPSGPQVVPGEYLVRISHGAYSDSANFSVLFDPRIPVETKSLQSRHDLAVAFMKNIKTATKAVDRLKEIQKTIKLVSEQIGKTDDDSLLAIKKLGKTVNDTAQKLLEQIIQKKVQGIRSDPNKVGSLLATAFRFIQSAYDAPGEREFTRIRKAEKALHNTLKGINTFIETDWQNYRQKVEKAKVSLFKAYDPLKF
ncbi:MAG TPA: hypothetical protein EYP36_00200 [Calditrichaeota bacterium]|nr:hypothetical protein [Calditrichota bacterium]